MGNIQCSADARTYRAPDQATVFIVEDDRDIRESIALIVASVCLRAVAYATAEEFLEKFSPTDAPTCLVLDIRLPGMSGLALQDELVARNVVIPVVFVSALSKLSLVVRAMRAGAIDFLEKPFYGEVLLSAIERSIDRDAQIRWKRGCGSTWSKRIELLSPRERQVLELLVGAKGTKQIAAELGIDPKTVAKHRAHVFEKLQIENLMEIRGSVSPPKEEAEQNHDLG